MEFAFDDTEGREGRVFGVAEIIALVSQDRKDKVEYRAFCRVGVPGNF